jgi:hypothetical protein
MLLGYTLGMAAALPRLRTGLLTLAGVMVSPVAVASAMPSVRGAVCHLPSHAAQESSDHGRYLLKHGRVTEAAPLIAASVGGLLG